MDRRGLFNILILSFLISSCGRQTPYLIIPGEGNFNNDWEFVKDQGGPVTPELFKKNIKQQSAWVEVTLPHTVNIEPVDSSGKQWQGIVRYRKFFTIPDKYKEKSVSLQFGAAMQVAKVYLNGELFLTHSGGYLPFEVKLDGKVRSGEENCILVELDNRDNPLVPPGKPLAELDFNYYSGLYRNATLAIKDKLHVSDPVAAGLIAGGGIMVTFINVTAQSAIINIQTDVENEYQTARNTSLQINIKDPEGRNIYSGDVAAKEIAASGFGRFIKQIRIDNPKLWSPDSPDLYRLDIRVLSDKQAVDSVSETIGIRTFSFSAENGFVLNGQKLKIRGTNRHQEYPYIGYALSDNAQYRDAVKIREAGFNFVRCSHYPQSPAFLRACDELGIMVMDPIPGWQFFGNEEFQENSINNVRQMVRRDRNHPSIIAWEASLNETEMPRQFMARAHNAVHEELTVADVYTSGWIDDVYDIFIPARQHASPPFYWNKYKKDKPLLIAEYGDWEYYAQNAGFNQTEFAGLKAEERSSRQLRGFGQKRMIRQALNYQESHNNNLNGPAVGDANWLIFDYKRGYAPDIESSGIMDIFRLPKFSFYFYQSQAEKAEPMIFIANYWNDPHFRDVRVFSNCDEVELSLNGKIITRQKPDRDRNSVNLKHPPFSFSVPEFIAGNLVARGFIGGKEVATTERATPGSPNKISIEADLSGRELHAGMNDAVFVYASVTDSVGTVVAEDSRSVFFRIEGDGELIGENPRKAEAGISAILLRAHKTSGTIVVKATADGLTAGQISINIH